MQKDKMWGLSLRLPISLSLGGKELIHHSIILPFSWKESGYRGCGLLDRNKAVPVPAKRVLFCALDESGLRWIPAHGTERRAGQTHWLAPAGRVASILTST